MSKTYQGYLLIADITGYTLYLSESELEHAQETLTALLELLVENTGPPLVISRLEGDAVISYGLKDNFYRGQTFIEKLEDTYVTFRKTLERLVLNNTCRCNACANISTLDLKFFVHYGSFGIQRISTYDELVGSDIILLHRLLKNSVVETTGYKAYSLYTDTAVQQLGLEGIEQAMTVHHEQYEHLDEVKVWVQDLHPVWEAKRNSVELTLPADEVEGEIEVFIEMPREQVWEYMIDPIFRNTLVGSDRMNVIKRSNGRIAPGSVYQCYHGDKAVPQTILEWTPFERMLVKELFPLSPKNGSINEYHLISEQGGTRLVKRFSKITGPIIGRIVVNMMIPFLMPKLKGIFEDFKHEIESDYQTREQVQMNPHEFPPDAVRQAASASLQASADKQS